jgi:hypothetical protein
MKTTTKPLFSNGTEMMWFQDRNCNRCVKVSRYNPKTDEYTQFKCTIDRDIQQQAFGMDEVNQQSYDICHTGICPKIKTDRTVKKNRDIKNQLKIELV